MSVSTAVTRPVVRAIMIAAGIGLMTAVTGCSGTSGAPAPGGTTGQGPATTGQESAMAIGQGRAVITTSSETGAAPPTRTSTVAGRTLTAAPPAPTQEPSAVAGDCPYLADDVVADINGQRTGATAIVPVEPYPICQFTRTDGQWLATVRIIAADSPQQAVAAVDAHVPVADSDPASQPPGWSGGSMPTDTGSVYAVSKGAVAVVAESNQQQSIKGRQLAVTAIANLGL